MQLIQRLSSIPQILFDLIGAVPEYRSLLIRILEKLRRFMPNTEDMAHMYEFRKKYISEHYNEHVMVNHVNCVFCTKLARYSQNRNMLYCSDRRYPAPAFLLPDTVLNDECEDSGICNIERSVPWYYRKPCPGFERLNKHKYLRNFSFPFNSITIRNHEFLEGETYGFLYNQKPCHICASIDYSIYCECISKKEYNTSLPCSIISEKITSVYRKPSGSNRQAAL